MATGAASETKTQTTEKPKIQEEPDTSEKIQIAIAQIRSLTEQQMRICWR